MTIRTRARSMILAGALLAAAVLPASSEDMVTRRDGQTAVDAPTTKVRVDERSGATHVKVRTPDSQVDVDTDRGRVRIRVPYFDGDIRW
jgi:hypothetical protein